MCDMVCVATYNNVRRICGSLQSGQDVTISVSVLAVAEWWRATKGMDRIKKKFLGKINNAAEMERIA